MVHFIFCYLVAAIVLCPFVMLIMMEMVENKGKIKNGIASYRHERYMKKHRRGAKENPHLAHEASKRQGIDVSSLNNKGGKNV